MESESDTLTFPEFDDASVLLFDVHGVTVCCTEPEREFSVECMFTLRREFDLLELERKLQ